MLKSKILQLISLAMLVAIGTGSVLADSVSLKLSRAELENMWRTRIQSFLDRGVIPMIDLESSLREKQLRQVNKKTFKAMDNAGLALMAFDGYQVPRSSSKQKGYRWSYYLHELVNDHPDRFILATNGGTNNNWFREKDSFIRQTGEQVSSGDYPIMGEFEFRHYMSGKQCKDGRTDRDIDIPIDGENGERLFQLSSDTGVAFVIHLEPEDEPVAALQRMLEKYPKARVVWAHFGQIRHPEKERSFTADNVRRWLTRYPNLYFDISTGQPGRTYKCNNNVQDVVLWQSSAGGQIGKLKPEFKSIMTDFSDRFVVGLDYGGGRDALHRFIKEKVSVRRLMIAELPEAAQHNIAYRNAWKLLTGKEWQDKKK